MRPRQPTTDNERPGRPHPPGHGGKDRTAGVPAELIQRRQLERRSPGPAANGSGACGTRLRLTAAEMNSAARRTAKLQAPWISDDQSRQPRRTS